MLLRKSSSKDDMWRFDLTELHFLERPKLGAVKALAEARDTARKRAMEGVCMIDCRS